MRREAMRLPSGFCLHDPLCWRTRRTPSTNTYTSLATSKPWQTLLFARLQTGCIVRGYVAINTKPSPHYVLTESTNSGCEVVLIPGLLPIFLHRCEIKSGWGLGTRLLNTHLYRSQEQIVLWDVHTFIALDVQSTAFTAYLIFCLLLNRNLESVNYTSAATGDSHVQFYDVTLWNMWTKMVKTTNPQVPATSRTPAMIVWILQFWVIVRVRLRGQ